MIEHFYIFYVNNGDNVYERTCGEKRTAEQRVKELKTRFSDAFYFENDIPKNFKYYY